MLDWLPGEDLYDYTRSRGVSGRSNPKNPHARFRALPVSRILDSLETIYAAHLQLAENGFIAVDFYDGCILYDFERAGRICATSTNIDLGPSCSRRIACLDRAASWRRRSGSAARGSTRSRMFFRWDARHSSCSAMGPLLSQPGEVRRP